MLLIPIALVSVTGCVTESTYQAAQIELADLRSTLTRTKDDVDQLTAQVARLQEVNQQQEHTVTELLDALQKERDTEIRWQKQVRERTDALVAKLNAMQNQQRWLARETEHAVKEQGALEALVAKYKGQLQDSVITPEPVVSPAPRDVDQTASQAATSTPPLPAPPPSVSPTPPPPPPEPFTPPARSKPTPEPQDDSWFSAVKGWLGSIWRMIFS